MFRYGNYIAKPEVDAEAGILYGRVLNISDVVCFQGRTVREAEQEFKNAVDAYIASCREKGKEPAKPFSGKLPFRTTPEIHRDIYIASARADKSINAWMEDVLSQAARQHNPESSVVSEKSSEPAISLIEYRRLLAQLQAKILQLQNTIKFYLKEENDDSFTRFFREFKPFIKDREFSDLLDKVETFQEHLRLLQYQESNLLALMDQSSESVPAPENLSMSNMGMTTPTSDNDSRSASVLPVNTAPKVDVLS